MRTSSGMASVARHTTAHNEYPVLRRFIQFDTHAVYFFLIMPHPENRAGRATDYDKPSFAGSFDCLLNIIQGGGKEEGATGMENATKVAQLNPYSFNTKEARTCNEGFCQNHFSCFQRY
jgi:hypothetical protein